MLKIEIYAVVVISEICKISKALIITSFSWKSNKSQALKRERKYECCAFQQRKGTRNTKKKSRNYTNIYLCVCAICTRPLTKNIICVHI